MIRMLLMAGAALCGTQLAAQDIKAEGAYIPLAPPGVMTHAAYLTLANIGTQQRSLIGVTAQFYGMAHLHQIAKHDGISMMSMVHQLDIAPGQTVTFEPGNIHIMLMQPQDKPVPGMNVALTLLFANGEEITVLAAIKPKDGGS